MPRPDHPNPEPRRVLGVDIGGTHITCGLVDGSTGRMGPAGRVDAEVDCHAPAESVLAAWAGVMRACLAGIPTAALRGIGIAMPGPFDYENGICLMRGVNKYDALYGINVRSELKRRLGLPAGCPVLFRNDAACFLLGEAWTGAARGARRVIGVTLGTGFGSSFLADDHLVEGGDSVPADGFLYCVPFRNAMAEDHFSGRGLLRLHAERGGAVVADVRGLAELAAGDKHARATFGAYGELLAEFLAPWIRRFRPDVIVFGGSISRAWDLFAPALSEALAGEIPRPALRPSELFEEAALIGSARLPMIHTEPPLPAAG